MVRIACAAAAAIAFVVGFFIGAWCDASDLIEWSENSRRQAAALAGALLEANWYEED